MNSINNIKDCYGCGVCATVCAKHIISIELNGDGFRTIDRKQKYLVTGTPCQIDSFRRYLQKFKKEDNFVLMDFLCHGCPPN